MNVITLICPICNISFERSVSQYNNSQKRAKGKYTPKCSIKCVAKEQAMKAGPISLQLICTHCGIEFQRSGAIQRKSARRKSKPFCSKICANVYRIRHTFAQPRKVISPQSICQQCNNIFDLYMRKDGKYWKSRFCKMCLLIKQSRGKLITEYTKGEIMAKHKNWTHGRGKICKHARKTYSRSSKPKICIVCGYDRHYEVAHIKPVADFSNETLISEINHLDNLTALCPIHHWEHDNGYLIL